MDKRTKENEERNKEKLVKKKEGDAFKDRNTEK